MATPQVAFSTTADDGNFYARKLQMLGGTIEGLRQRAEERRQKKEQMELAEVQRFFSAAEGMPELASTWGSEIKAKYGSKYPGVGQMVDAISKRAELPAMVESAGTDFASRVNAMEQKRAQREQQIAQMPDTIDAQIPVPQYGPFGAVGQALAPFGIQQQPVTVPVPNEEKQRAFAEHRSVDPAYIPFMAAQEMPYEQRLAAGIWAKQRGGSIPAPSPFDAFGDDLSDQDKMALAVQREIITGEPAEAWRVRAGLKQSPRRLQEQGYQRDERIADETFSERDRIARNTDQEKQANRKLALEKERLEYAHRLAVAREDRNFTHQSDLISQREANEDGDIEDTVKDLAKNLVDDSEFALDSYDDELDQAITGIISPKEIAEAKRKFVTERGSRPASISRLQARQIERHVREQVEAGKADDPEAAASDIVAYYMAATGRGIAPSEAMNIALGKAEAPVATPKEKAREKVNKIKAKGDVNKPTEKKKAAATALEPAPAVTPADVDPGRVKNIIRKAHPNWTDAQIDKEVAAYVASKGGGG